MRKDSPFQSGYAQVTTIYKKDRQWIWWKTVSQLLCIICAILAGYIAYGIYDSLVMWPWMMRFWAAMGLKCVCDFMAGRLKA